MGIMSKNTSPSDAKAPQQLLSPPTVLCWACGVLVQIPIVGGELSPVFRCGWCGAISEAAPEGNVLARRRRGGVWRSFMRLLSRLSYIVVVFVLCLMLSIILPGIGFVLPQLCTSSTSWLFHITITYILTASVIFNYLAAVFTTPGTVLECCDGLPPAFTSRGKDDADICSQDAARAQEPAAANGKAALTATADSSNAVLSSKPPGIAAGSEGSSNTSCTHPNGSGTQASGCACSDSPSRTALDAACAPSDQSDSPRVGVACNNPATNVGTGVTDPGDGDSQTAAVAAAAEEEEEEESLTGAIAADTSGSGGGEGCTPSHAAEAGAAASSGGEDERAQQQQQLVPQFAYAHLRYCWPCGGPQPPEAHHCHVCGRCVVDQDHHCPFIANCVGRANQRNFLLFLASTVAAVSYSAVMSAVLLAADWHLAAAALAEAAEALSGGGGGGAGQHGGGGGSGGPAGEAGGGGGGLGFGAAVAGWWAAAAEGLWEVVEYVAVLMAHMPLHLKASAYVFLMSVAILVALGILLVQSVRHAAQGSCGRTAAAAAQHAARHHLHPASDAAAALRDEEEEDGDVEETEAPEGTGSASKRGGSKRSGSSRRSSAALTNLRRVFCGPGSTCPASNSSSSRSGSTLH
ncbi:hypothetical protein Agub_g6310, partial [Astrephomene gubernaculifera]